jgi:hypothetical protein
MLKEKKLYSVLLVLLAFSLIGEQPNLKGDLKRASDHVVRTLQVNEVIAGWQSFVDNAGNIYRGISDRLRASANVAEPAAPVDSEKIAIKPVDNHYKDVEKKLNNNSTKCPLTGMKGRGC